MKALLVLLAIAAGVWLYKRGQRISSVGAPRKPPPDKPPPGKPQPMLRCAHCGIHLPASDALPGRAGRVYCCAAHQRDMEGG